MHIPDGFLTPPVWVPLDVISGTSVAVALHRVSKTFEEKTVPLMGVLAAFVFAGQMLNIPVAGGTSGHFLGGALAGALLGPSAGLLIITTILLVQCFLFQDGGIAALGANIFNMGILGSMLGALLYRAGIGVLRGTRKIFWAGFFAGWIAMVVSAFSCAGELWVSGVVSWSTGVSLIVGVHAVLGVLEGVVTGVVLESVSHLRPDLFHFGQVPISKKEWIVGILVVVLLLSLAPFASKLPDAVQRLVVSR